MFSFVQLMSCYFCGASGGSLTLYNWLFQLLYQIPQNCGPKITNLNDNNNTQLMTLSELMHRVRYEEAELQAQTELP